jgi:hypothetical protein
MVSTPAAAIACATSILLEQGYSRGSTRISKDLGKFWEEHAQQGLQFILVAGDFVTELTVQPYQFAIGRNQLAWHVPWTRFSTEEHSRYGGGIQLIGFRS